VVFLSGGFRPVALLKVRRAQINELTRRSTGAKRGQPKRKNTIHNTPG